MILNKKELLILKHLLNNHRSDYIVAGILHELADETPKLESAIKELGEKLNIEVLKKYSPSLYREDYEDFCKNLKRS